MSESATEKHYPWPSCSTRKMPSEESAIRGAEDELQGIFSELGKGACETVENLITKIGESMK